MGKKIERFRERLIRHLLEVLDGRPEPFMDTLARSQNCDPAFLTDTLHEMVLRRLVRQVDGSSEGMYALTPRVKAVLGNRRRRSRIQVDDPKSGCCDLLESNYYEDLLTAMRNALPEPCLVYSQWWFSKPTYARLIDLLLRLTTEDTRIAFVGASTLAAVFSQCAASPAVVIDVDEILLKQIAPYSGKMAQAICCDVSRPLDTSLKGRFDLVVSDPPWSKSTLRTFLLRGAELLALAGTLVISFPPVFTRPSAQAERAQLLRTAETIGLSLVDRLLGFTEYGVPLFERRAYRTHNLELDRPWRRGDVFVFKKTAASTEFDGIPIAPAYSWDQYDYGVARLFLKKNGSAEDGPARIIPVSGLDDLTYDSTSSRTQMWKHASLVSTRNQIADVSGTEQLRLIFRELLGRTANLNDGIRTLGGIRPDTQVALSIMLDGSGDEEDQRGESKWRLQEESNSHVG